MKMNIDTGKARVRREREEGCHASRMLCLYTPRLIEPGMSEFVSMSVCEVYFSELLQVQTVSRHFFSLFPMLP